jgi:hypothetical protein
MFPDKIDAITHTLTPLAGNMRNKTHASQYLHRAASKINISSHSFATCSNQRANLILHLKPRERENGAPDEICSPIPADIEFFPTLGAFLALARVFSFPLGPEIAIFAGAARTRDSDFAIPAAINGTKMEQL